MPSLAINTQPSGTANTSLTSHLTEAFATAKKTITRFEDALEHIYDDRYRASTTALFRFLHEHPAANAVVHGAIAALGLGGCIGMALCTEPTPAHLALFAGGMVLAAAACFHGGVVACNDVKVRARASTVTYEESKGFAAELKAMTPEEHSALAPAFERWGTERVAAKSISPQAFFNLREIMNSTRSSDKAYSHAGAALTVTTAVLGGARDWQSQIEGLLASCSPEGRPSIATFMRDQLFVGEACKAPLDGPETQKLYDLLTKV